MTAETKSPENAETTDDGRRQITRATLFFALGFYDTMHSIERAPGDFEFQADWANYWAGADAVRA